MNQAAASEQPNRNPGLSESGRRRGTAYDVVVVGGGAGGMAALSSLMRRRPELRVCLVEPSSTHYYQPGWTLVGAGVFAQNETSRSMESVIPKRVDWLQQAVSGFDPGHNEVHLANGESVGYRVLIAAPGLKLDWDAIEGLNAALGHHGVTSNYRFDLAPYTWRLVQGMQRGTVLFTQPPMPIKCAGAPQKAMYLSADHWLRSGSLEKTSIEFHSAASVLFGVKDYVPALMEYVRRYEIDLNFGSALVAVDGPAQLATFRQTNGQGGVTETVRRFDMLHVCPPQTGHDFVRSSPLAGPDGWIDVDPFSLRHSRFQNVFALGDATNTANAKTAAAARKQGPVVAENALAMLDQKPLGAAYDGYGSCPLTVERGKVVLAEFGYGGKLLPTFPDWLLDGRRPTALAWHLKAQLLPQIYWNATAEGSRMA